MYQSKNCGHGFDLYIKTTQYLRPVLAPLTREEELRQELLNITGEVYLPFVPSYCPMCGKKVEGGKE